MEIVPLTPAIGAQIRGVDLAQPLTGSVVRSIEECLLDRLVVFFPGQDIADDELRRFGRYFGDLEVHPFLPNGGRGFEDVQILANAADPGSVTRADQWHSDNSFEAEPSMGSVLRAVTIPDLGGDTVWSSMYAAYDALSAPMRDLLTGFEATHGSGFGSHLDAPNIHPVVRTHPVTGRKALYVNRVFTSRINGLPAVEARRLLETLLQHIESSMFQVRWRWQSGDVALWDNRCTQHYGVFDYVGSRELHRVTIRGDKPFA